MRVSLGAVFSGRLCLGGQLGLEVGWRARVGWPCWRVSRSSGRGAWLELLTRVAVTSGNIYCSPLVP